MSQPPVNPPGDPGRRPLGRLKRNAPVAEPSAPSISIDPTTGVPSRSHLVDWANAAIQRSHQSSNRAVVAFVEAGLLRDVNDTYGADVGDALLRDIGARLSTIDLPNTRVVRYGGAEFVVLFEHIANAEDAAEIGNFLVDLMSSPFDLGHAQITLAPYVGAAVSADNYTDLDDLIHDAQQALSRAREEGPGSWEVHDESKRGRYETRIDESRLHGAIENDEFVLVYEPIVRVGDGKIVGMEAALRWKSASATNTGLLTPTDFADLLEKSGLIVRVGHWIIHEACRQIAAWNHRFPQRDPLVVLCPIGARQLAAKDLAEQVIDAVQTTGIAPQQLCLVLTDESLRLHSAAAWSRLRELKEHNIRLGLSGFGTGVSAVSYLRDFSLDIVQVSPVFVQGLAISADDLTIVKYLAGMLNELRIVGIAVGVENAEQLAALKPLGVPMAQGTHLGRAALAESITRLLEPETAAKPAGATAPS